MSIYRFILMGAVLGIMFASCNDWLDVRPETEQKEKEQFSAYKGFRSALTGCYIAMAHQDAYGEKLTMSHVESLASLWYVPNQPYDQNRLVDYYLVRHDYNDVACNALQGIYSKLFNIIVQANKIIVNAEANAGVFPDEATRCVILGEAYAIRAYCQLDVLRLFGEVPNGSGAKVNLPYSEVTEFDQRAARYDFSGYTQKLFADLNKAEQLLKDNDPVFYFTFSELNNPEEVLDDTYLGYRQSRLNYWAVKALQARAYLYVGKREEAYAAAKAILEAEDAEGDPVMELSGDDDRNEGMFACPNECLFYLSKHNVRTTAKFLIGGAADVEARSENLYTTRSRLDQDLFPENKDADSRYVNGWNKLVKKNNAAIKKYYFSEEAEDLDLYYAIVPMLRMSEVYLIAIETTGDSEEANSLYADYMLEGCGMALNDDVFTATSGRTEVLLPEYRREFFAEGQMFYAYKRTGASQMLWCGDEITDEQYVLWNAVSKNFNP